MNAFIAIHSKEYMLRDMRCLPRLAILALLGMPLASPAWASTVTTISYDAGDHVTQVIDPRGLMTKYTYDGLGQLWTQVSPDTGTTSYTYDSYGRRATMTRADGTQTSYGYDGLNRVTSISAGGQVQHFAYDSCPNGLGRLCTVSDGTGTVAYSYTPEGWVSGRGFTVGSTSYTLTYSHDNEGRVTAVLYPDDNQASYSYSKGVVSSITLTVNGATVSGASAITYRPGDLAVSGWTSSNGLTNTLSYDSDGRLTRIAVPGVESLGFSYDTADRITGITNGTDTNQSEAFDYDEQSRLTGVYGGSETESYSYDADGNRLTQTINGTSASFSYSATNNQLTGISGAVTMSYGYDAQGNTTTENNTATYGYDPFNRLSSAGSATDYVGPEGQRLRKITSSGTTYFAPDAGGPLLAESSGGAWIDYVWLNGQMIGRIAGGEVDAIHNDQTGRPQVVTDASKTVVWKATNYPFEREVTQDDIGGLNLGFPGQYYDQERGTWNNGFRDYNASLGRYVESDPAGLNGGINSYAYAGNAPVSVVDPYGLYCLKEWEIRGIAGATVGAAIGAAAGSESGPGALLTASAGLIVNGGIGVIDGLLSGNQATGAAEGAAGVMVSGETKADIPGGVIGGSIGGAVSSDLENRGYPRAVAVGSGGFVGGSVGTVITSYMKGVRWSSILKGGLKGGGVGLAAGLVQTGLESAIRSGNSCGCGK